MILKFIKHFIRLNIVGASILSILYLIISFIKWEYPSIDWSLNWYNFRLYLLGFSFFSAVITAIEIDMES